MSKNPPSGKYSYRKTKYAFDVREKVSDLKQKIGCQICGIKDSCCLDFHHLNDKEHTIGHMIAKRQGYAKILAEISKCSLVCANCHRKIHAGLLESPTETIQKHIQSEIDRMEIVLSPAKIYDKKCPFCDRNFQVKKSEEDKKFCSKNCFHKSTRKLEWPSKDELTQKLEAIQTWTGVAKIYGVTDNTIRKWARKYNII